MSKKPCASKSVEIVVSHFSKWGNNQRNARHGAHSNSPGECADNLQGAVVRSPPVYDMGIAFGVTGAEMGGSGDGKSAGTMAKSAPTPGRLSICGKFVIDSSGAWTPVSDSVPKTHKAKTFEATESDVLRRVKR